MRWIPRINDDEMIKGRGSLLRKARRKLGTTPQGYFKDDIGVVAFELQKHLVVAKGYIYGWVVSAHKGIVERALQLDKKLLMFIDKSNAFYEFDPFIVMRNGTKNHRGKVEMLNFDIKLGVRYDPQKNHKY